MASTQLSPDNSRPSFAKVAAAVSNETVSDKSPTDKPPSQPIMVTPMVVSSASVQPRQLKSEKPSPAPVDRLTASLNYVKLEPRIPNLVVNGTCCGSALERQRALLSRECGSDESQRCDSSSELGTKPPSLDGKSITSGTTFAMDEKESLRPDDSASVKAAAEDDDVFSVRGSLIAASRISSDIAVRARGIQLGDMPERRPVQKPLEVPEQGALTPQSPSSDQPPIVNTTMPLGTDTVSDALNVIYRQAPDEKLLDALASPRDRYYLLRLEKDVIEFVQDSKEPYMDLPPSNSFCRMLTHKLADYYHMTHSFEPNIGSVRIFRTPFCRVPPSLATMTPQPSVSTSSTPPPAVLPMKIMRRGQPQEIEAVGADVSKPTSESGSDGKEGKEKQPIPKEKLSREEREEMYKLARERIFGSSDASIQESEAEIDMSRTSSMSATNRANVGKRGKTGKQRRDDSDSFDSRNQYTPYWGPQQQTWVAQPQGCQFMPAAPGQFESQSQPPYSGPMTSGYGHQPPGFSAATGAAGPQGPMYNAYCMPQYQAQQPPPPRFPSPMPAYGPSASQTPSSTPQSWQPGYTQPAYQARGPTAPPCHSHNGIPYPFGQLPANANPHDPKSQHPIPGSYNRNHSFNPMTQSFVPGANGVHATQLPQPPFTAPGSHHSSPQITTSHAAYNGYQTPAGQPYSGGYNMARQGSSNSIPPYHGPPGAQHALPPTVPSFPQGLPQHTHLPTPPAHIPSRPAVPQGPSQMYSHLPTYGNPATLPQKPATGV
ncbi:hypothetical protein CDD82_1488 [Ophiocordyceps australis]|uniref:R3H domain-containing protein n=1 Tax=Ophiocordyceps australis TaxID=1399860 RepID=A0A2C5ZM28_9HYPO|nr:hypothetical protein CDD82_1488 [Ophiocordyceps australis]